MNAQDPTLGNVTRTRFRQGQSFCAGQVVAVTMWTTALHFHYSARRPTCPLVSFASRRTRKRCWQDRHRNALNRQNIPRKRSAVVGWLRRTSLLPHARHRIFRSISSDPGIKLECSLLHPVKRPATKRVCPSRRSPQDLASVGQRFALPVAGASALPESSALPSC
jgi:hypothetical protein